MFNLVPWKKRNNIKVRQDADLSRRDYPDYDDGFFPMAEFRREMDRIWDRFWDDWTGLSEWHGGRRLGWNIDADEKENEYVLRAELPGFDPEDIDVSISGNVMTVRAEHKHESNGNNGSSYSYGQFLETFSLPVGVETDNVDAQFHNGLLEVHLPKSEDTNTRRITVKSA